MGRKLPQRHLTLDELRMYLQPALNDEREAEVEAHLAGCAACHKKAQTVRRLFAVADSLKFAAQRQAKVKVKAKTRSVPPAARL